MTKTVAFVLAILVGAGVARGAESRNVAILVHQGVELLDFAGPGEVFTAAGSGAFNVFTVGPTLDPIFSQGFVKITPEYSIDTSPRPDIIVIPGGSTAVLYNDPKVMAWIKDRARTAELTMSVCNGAITLAKTGLLDGLKATTHWGSVPSLQKFPRITVVPNERFVDNGRIVSTQGVSAGIDGALHVVERLLGAEAAWADAHYMMYAWEPHGLSKEAKAELRPWIEQDWRAVAATYRRKLDADPKDAVAAARVGTADKELGDNEHAVAMLERAVGLGARDADTLEELGEAHFALGHYEAAARIYEEEVPLRFVRLQAVVGLNAARAWSRAGNKDAAVAALQRSIATGKIDRKSLEKDPDLAGLRADPRFGALVRGAL
jgi:putative intracellular protease/amidase